MKQDNVFEATRKATQIPLKFTQSVIEQSKKLRNPSPKVDKIGTAIGSCVGAALLFTGTAQVFSGKSLWALGTITAGAVTIIFNHYHKKKIKG